IAVYFQSRQAPGETQSCSWTRKRRPTPDRLRGIWWVRNLDRAVLALLFIGAVVLPLLVAQPSRHLLYTTVLVFAFIGMSLTVLTGWAGQLSLGQMAFAGIGALVAASLRRGVRLDIGWGSTRLVQVALKPVTFGVALI